MDTPRTGLKYYLHVFFEAGIALKAFNGLWETISGLLGLLISHDLMLRGFYALSHGELLEDPQDRLVHGVGYFLTTTPHGTRMFIALYVLAHGLANLFLAYNLFRNRLWAYPATVGALVLFLVYQIYRIYLFHSLTLTALTLIDIVFLALLLHEYSHQLKKSTVA